MLKKPGVLPWFVVFLVGAIVVAIVLALGLFGRLDSAQKVLDAGKPVVQQNRIDGDVAAITMISAIPDTLDPLMLKSGGGAAEVSPLLAYAAKKTKIPASKILAAVTKAAPHTAALLQAVSLDQVNKEIPKLVTFLAGALKTTPDQVVAALHKNFPRLSQTIDNLPIVVAGWDNVPGVKGLTRFSGTPVTTLPQVRDYFKDDVIPTIAKQGPKFRNLSSKGGVGYIPLLLTAIGIVVMVFALLFMFLASKGPLPAKLRRLGWLVVILVGAVVVAYVLVFNLFGRLGDGNDVLKGFKPVFQQQRVEGGRAGLDFATHVAAMSDPIVRSSGGGAAEVPKLLTFVSQQTGLTQTQVVAALHKSFPHTLALLQAIPLSAVTKERDAVLKLATGKKTVAEAVAKVATLTPHLAQALVALPKVTNGWNNIPGTENLTRFDGQRVKTAPQAIDYFSKDVYPVVEKQRGNFKDTNDPWPPVNYFPPLLLVVGIVVILFGLLNLRSKK